jgi:hypothetical protein
MQVLPDIGLEEVGNTTVTFVEIDNALLRFETKVLQKLSQSVVLSFEQTFSMKSVGDSFSYECVIIKMSLFQLKYKLLFVNKFLSYVN